jgi:magnesium transporter
MKPMPLRRFAAPSPTVLSFLRQALDPTSAPCVALRGQRCGYATGSTAKRAGTGIRGGDTASGSGSVAFDRGLASHQRARLDVGAVKSEAALFTPQRFGHDVAIHSHTVAFHRRAFSSTSSSKAWELFGRRQLRESRSLPPPPPLSEVMGDAPIPIGFESLGRMTRAANELKMRCTELDDQGNVTMVSGEFKKSELIAKVNRESVWRRASIVLTKMPVWSSPSRSPQDRFVAPTQHPHPTDCYPDQPSPHPRPYKTQSRVGLRRIWYHRFKVTVCLHVRS